MAGRLASFEAKGELGDVTRQFENAMAIAAHDGHVSYDLLPTLRFTSTTPSLKDIIRSSPATYISVELARLVDEEAAVIGEELSDDDSQG